MRSFFDHLIELGIQLSKFEELWVFPFQIFESWKSTIVFVAAAVKF